MLTKVIQFCPKVADFYRILFFVIGAMLITGCAGTKSLAEGEHLVGRVKVEINGKPSNSEEDYELLRQKPNKRFLGMRPYVSFYNWGEKNKTRALGKWAKSVGEAPTISDSTSHEKTAKALGRHYFNLGYFGNEVSWESKVKGKTERITYSVYTGPRYTIDQITVECTHKMLNELMEEYQSALEVGQPLITEGLEQEQVAMVAYLKNKGLYNAKSSWVTFELDTLGRNYSVGVQCVIAPHSAEDALHIKHIDGVVVLPNFNYADTSFAIEPHLAEGEAVCFQEPALYRPGWILEQVGFEIGDMYTQESAKETYEHLSYLSTFKSVGLEFIEQDSAVFAVIKLVPQPKRSVIAELEGKGSTGNFGIGGSLHWDNRNVFGGGELFQLILSGQVSEQRNSTNESWLVDARELMLGTQLSIPGIAFPGAKNWINPTTNRPNTIFSASLTQQIRQGEFNRFGAKAMVGYQWRTKNNRWSLTPAELNYVGIDFSNDSTASKFLYTGFQNMVFVASRLQWSMQIRTGKTLYGLSITGESGGNLAQSLGIETPNDLPLAQYVQGQWDAKFHRELGRRRTIAGRTFLGITHHYGALELAPFEKSFYMGGSGDLRGWTAYHFGPGAVPETLLGRSGYFTAAPIKWVNNLEFRFPMSQNVYGALFLDVGNMWLWNREYNGNYTSDQLLAIEAGKFHWDTFYKQLGANTGFGFRYDLDYFILRVDTGVRLYHPGAVNRNKWVIQNLTWNDLSLNMGIGYPF